MKRDNRKQEVEASAVQSKEPVRLKINRASLDDLSAILPLHSFGRFMELKMLALQEIRETPEDQFAIVKVTPEMIENKKELASALHALTAAMKRENWVVRYSRMAKGFLLVRREQYEKIKKLKNGGR